MSGLSRLGKIAPKCTKLVGFNLTKTPSSLATFNFVPVSLIGTKNGLLNAEYVGRRKESRGPNRRNAQPVEEVDLFSRPDSKAYFTGNSKYYELITGLDQCILSYTEKDPFYSQPPKDEDIISEENRKIVWLSLSSMGEYLDMQLSKSQYKAIIARLDRLVGEDFSESSDLPASLKDYLSNFSASGLLEKKKDVIKTLDNLGRSYSVGKRKEASVRCWLVKGDGKVMINGRPLGEYFTRNLDRESAIYPLSLTDSLTKYNAWLVALGGGTTGQAQAISLALSKGLVVHDSTVEPILKEAKLLNRDRRVVERKKTGQPKARKHFTWVKR